MLDIIRYINHVFYLLSLTIIYMKTSFYQFTIIIVFTDVNSYNKRQDATPLYSALHLTYNPDIINLLLRYGVNINHTIDTGATALYGAVNGNNLKLAKCLFENGADPNIAKKDGISPLKLAIFF